MKRYLALLLLSPLLFAEIETYICDCDSFMSNTDFRVRDCPGNPKSSDGLIINFNEKTMSYQNKKYFYKDNPNTLSGRYLDYKKGTNGEMLSDKVYEIEFEKVTKALNLEITDYEKESLQYTLIFSCSSS
tara:strand:- start:1509 stop:1898 length:390 start_codon:yes stop_codon:yes gene_type:complete